MSQVNPHTIPFLSVDSGNVNDSKLPSRYITIVKELLGNEMKHWFRQLNVLGLLP